MAVKAAASSNAASGLLISPDMMNSASMVAPAPDPSSKHGLQRINCKHANIAPVELAAC
jgi:hypothetical protein